ncbi:FAD-dependent monooxygenase [Streptomyces boncukensis]|uniref:Monooxygenase n=1 Tax=Streptomyces boncukensis TaxID=2711219 RepID=A0A6G4WY88_9ACTN|nr:monooxygenase [Streptomyces boncukensis]
MEPVIVAGAGPTGLALSLALARHSVPSVVLDATDGGSPPRAARTCVLRRDTAAHLAVLPGQRWRSWRTERRRHLVERVELDEETAPLHLEQHTLERALRTALEDEQLARVVPHSHVDQLEQDPSGVTVHTRGAAGTWWRGSYAVGCDGARSTVRKLLGVRFPGHTAVERHAVAAVRVQLPWEDEALLQRDPGGVPGEVTARPLAGGIWRLDWLLPPRGDLVTPEELLERVQDTLTLWFEAADGHGAPGPYELVDTGVHTAHQRLARHWRVDRAFLAGDAAHLQGALGVQSVDEGLRDAANLAWKLALAWHHGHDDAAATLLDSYEAERRAAVGARLRAVDQALPLVRRGGGGLRALLPGGGARAHLGLLTDGHLGRGLLGAPATYARTPLSPPRGEVTTVPVGTAPGAPVRDVAVTAADGTRGRLRDWLCGAGGELLVVLIAPGTAVWDSRHWLSAGMMPSLAAAVDDLPVRATLLVAEGYPDAAAHTVLVVRSDGHLVAALPAARPAELRSCAEAIRGAQPVGGPVGRGNQEP